MSDRHELQAEGTHPAPCARHCEAKAFETEIRRLRHDIEHHVRIATEATQEAEQLRAELAAIRHELDGARKAANVRARLIESLQHQKSHLSAQRDQWVEALNTLDSERAANARLTDELAACREREARMRVIGGQLSNVAFNLAQRAGHVISSDNCSLLDGLRKQWDAALAEGAQG